MYTKSTAVKIVKDLCSFYSYSDGVNVKACALSRQMVCITEFVENSCIGAISCLLNIYSNFSLLKKKEYLNLCFQGQC